MAKEITFQQTNPQMGEIKGTLRIIGKDLFLKVNSYQYSRQLLNRFKEAGCLVEEGNKWIKVNLFHTNKNIILGGVTLDSEEETSEDIETKLFEFYMMQYAKAGMKVDGKEL